jgi:hypothetical protein
MNIAHGRVLSLALAVPSRMAARKRRRGSRGEGKREQRAEQRWRESEEGRCGPKGKGCSRAEHGDGGGGGLGERGFGGRGERGSRGGTTERQTHDDRNGWGPWPWTAAVRRRSVGGTEGGSRPCRWSCRGAATGGGVSKREAVVTSERKGRGLKVDFL